MTFALGLVIKSSNKMKLIGYVLKTDTVLNRIICNFHNQVGFNHRQHKVGKISYELMDRLSSFQCVYSSSWNHCNDSTLPIFNSNSPLKLLNSTIEISCCRNKSTKKSQKRPEYDSDSDSDVEEDLPQGTRMGTLRLQSLRVDGVLKKALNVARTKVETAFYGGNIRLNGKKPDKKSSQVRIGDELDLIKGPSPMNPDYLSVSRVEVISVNEDEDQLLVKVKISKTLYIENYEIHPWKHSDSVE